MMKEVLVTGGAGFIGSNLVKKLLDLKEYKVSVIDNFDPFYLKEFKIQNLSEFQNHPNFHFYENDILDIKSLENCLESKPDIIVHLAAKAGVRPSILDPLAYQTTNIIGTQNLLECAKKWGTKQFVFGSSSSVYGVNEDVPWSEKSTLLPISPYASSKLSAEFIGHYYSFNYPIRFIALRFFTVYGPGQRPDLAINKFFRLIMNGEPIPVYGDGSTYRDYTYVDDIVEGIYKAMNYSATNYEVMNIGNNIPVKLIDLINTIEEVIGKKAIIQWKPEQIGDVPKTYADIAKAKELLDYAPKTPLVEGLTHFKKWVQNNSKIKTLHT